MEPSRRCLSEVEARGFPVADIARTIRNRRVYRQRDDGPVSLQQVHAQILHCPQLFQIDRSVSEVIRAGPTNALDELGSCLESLPPDQ